MKKVFLGLLILILVSIKTEGAQVNSKLFETNTFQSNMNRAVGLRVNALYFRPDNITNDVEEKSDYILLDLKTDFQWGVGIAYDYNTPEGRDFKIEWLHYRNNQNNSLTANDIQGEGVTTVPYSYNSDFDFLYLEMGKWIDLNEDVLLRMHGGLAYAYIDVGQQYNFTTNTTQSTQTFKEDYLYHAVGARAGLELQFLFTPEFNVFIKTSMLALGRTGKHKYDAFRVIRNAGIVSISGLNENSPIQGALFGTDTSLALNYNQTSPSSDVIFTIGARGIVFLADWAKWGGPFVGIKWLGN